jgi:orotate phosphoribosyltransferase
MQAFQKEFIEFAISNNVLCFGDFTLKSGRKSPYFFNTGLFNDGLSLARLGQYFANAIELSGLKFDMLFGPAYKGIPLASAVAIAYNNLYNRNLPFAFNRKETKNHGEGGNLFGAPLCGKILIVDDVISAGTSVNLSAEIICQAGAEAAGVVVAMDRQEQGQTGTSAIREIEQYHDLDVISVITLDNLIEYLQLQSEMEGHLNNIYEYRKHYGSK